LGWVFGLNGKSAKNTLLYGPYVTFYRVSTGKLVLQFGTSFLLQAWHVRYVGVQLGMRWVGY